MAKRAKKRRQRKKGPPPRQQVQTKRKVTPQLLFLYIVGILVVISMSVGLIFAKLGGSGVQI